MNTSTVQGFLELRIVEEGLQTVLACLSGIVLRREPHACLSSWKMGSPHAGVAAHAGKVLLGGAVVSWTPLVFLERHALQVRQSEVSHRVWQLGPQRAGSSCSGFSWSLVPGAYSGGSRSSEQAQGNAQGPSDCPQVLAFYLCSLLLGGSQD